MSAASKVCPNSDGELSAEAFNEATIYSGQCGYVEAWHRVACDDNPQVTPCRAADGQASVLAGIQMAGPRA